MTEKIIPLFKERVIPLFKELLAEQGIDTVTSSYDENTLLVTAYPELEQAAGRLEPDQASFIFSPDRQSSLDKLCVVSSFRVKQESHFEIFKCTQMHVVAKKITRDVAERLNVAIGLEIVSRAGAICWPDGNIDIAPSLRYWLERQSGINDSPASDELLRWILTVGL